MLQNQRADDLASCVAVACNMAGVLFYVRHQYGLLLAAGFPQKGPRSNRDGWLDTGGMADDCETRGVGKKDASM